jgi:hypothetical protein
VAEGPTSVLFVNELAELVGLLGEISALLQELGYVSVKRLITLLTLGIRSSFFLPLLVHALAIFRIILSMLHDDASSVEVGGVEVGGVEVGSVHAGGVKAGCVNTSVNTSVNAGWELNRPETIKRHNYAINIHFYPKTLIG